MADYFPSLQAIFFAGYAGVVDYQGDAVCVCPVGDYAGMLLAVRKTPVDQIAVTPFGKGVCGDLYCQRFTKALQKNDLVLGAPVIDVRIGLIQLPQPG